MGRKQYAGILSYHLGSMLMPASLAPRSVRSSWSSKAPRLCSSCTAFRRDSSGGASIACVRSPGWTEKGQQQKKHVAAVLQTRNVLLSHSRIAALSYKCSYSAFIFCGWVRVCVGFYDLRRRAGCASILKSFGQQPRKRCCKPAGPLDPGTLTHANARTP